MVQDEPLRLFAKSLYSADEYPTNLVYTNHYPYQHNEYLKHLDRLHFGLFCDPARTAVDVRDLNDDSDGKSQPLRWKRDADLSSIQASIRKEQDRAARSFFDVGLE